MRPVDAARLACALEQVKLHPAQYQMGVKLNQHPMPGLSGNLSDAEVARRAAGVLEGALQCLAREVVQAALEVATEHRHGDAGDIDLGHGVTSRMP